MADKLAERGETKTIRGLLESDNFKVQVSRALPKHLTPDRFIRVAVTAMNRVPKLAECDQPSFFNALLSLSQLGLEPDGRRAHLIPFRNNKLGITECQLIIDYKGLVELAMRSGSVANIHADVVCENDVFEYNCGEIREHKIDFRKERGKVYAAYALCKFKDGTVKAEVMGVDEINAIKERSKAGSFGPWITDWNEMAKKTVFRRLSKWLPLSPEYRDILDKDADTFDPIALASKANVPPPPLKKQAEPIIDVPEEPAQEQKSEPEPPPPVHNVQPGETEPPDDETSPTNFDENTVDGLRNKIRDEAASHFQNPQSFSLWLKTLTRNDEKGFCGIDSLDQSKSYNQLKFIVGALRREVANKKKRMEE
jgi:recombination protein RecT